MGEDMDLGTIIKGQEGLGRVVYEGMEYNFWACRPDLPSSL